DKNNIRTLDEYEEHIGKGIEAKAHDRKIKIGSASFVREDRPAAAALAETANKTSVHISSNDEYRGCFVFQSTYREGVAELFSELGQDKQLFILSGDNDGEREKLQEILPEGTQLFFDQKPADKLKFIKDLQEAGKNVMMIGDGLNDAGALAQSDVGIAVSENINIFSPACDGILDATKFQSLRQFLDLSALGMKVIKWSFLLSLLYNLAGLAFAVTGHLRPVVAAILMPLSSISIVLFTSLVTHFLGKRLTK
ncbi:MAG: HAD-IC family P-type ATPase, partial [Salegentibacter sp.]